jgi:D-alanyl-D-alanine carboxypeptidase (penicillin-binding protein 5/6)
VEGRPVIKNKTLLILVIIFIVFSTNAVAEELPNIDAKAYVLMDTTTGRILEGKNEDEKRAMASTTKIMTAIIALEKGDLASIVEVSKKAASIRGSSFHLSRGEKIPLETMLYGLLLCSGNDAAVAIAEHIGESQENFVQMMNQKAIEIGALNTNFKNPHGLDEPNHFTTTKDLAIIARYALDIPKFREIVGSREKLITRGDKTGTIYNTNKLLWSFENATGIKTGYTGKAGRCLVASAYKNGFELISVVLGSPSNFNSSYKLLNFGFTKYQLRQIIKKDNIVKSIPVKKGILARLYQMFIKCSIFTMRVFKEFIHIEHHFIILGYCYKADLFKETLCTICFNIYIVLNKPAGVVTTSKDPFGRPTVLDLVKGIKARIYPVGRLDKDTEGLLILTNDGDLTYKLTHPKNEIKKTYIVEVKGTLTPKKVRALKEGVVLDDGITAPAKIKPLNTSKNNTTLKIVIHEGRKRQIRRMCEAVGLSVVYLKRTHIEKFSLGNLKPGCWRYLTNREINYLKNL